MFWWDDVDTSPDLGGHTVLKAFKMAIFGHNRQTTWTELERVFCRWFYYQFHSKIFFWSYWPGSTKTGRCTEKVGYQPGEGTRRTVRPWCNTVPLTLTVSYRQCSGGSMRGAMGVIAPHKRQTDTHPFNGPFSWTTRVSRYQKGKTNLDFTEARDGEWQWHQLGHMQVYTYLQTDNHASTPPLSFLQAGCPSCRPTNSVKALKAVHT